MRSSMRPRQVIVNFRGVDHQMDLNVCRLALVRRQVAGEFDSMASFGAEARHPASSPQNRPAFRLRSRFWGSCS